MLDEGNGLVRRKPVRRTPAERSAIVAETYQPGATVAGVAQRHGIVASQLSSWRTVEKGKAGRDNRRGSGFPMLNVVCASCNPPAIPQAFHANWSCHVLVPVSFEQCLL